MSDELKAVLTVIPGIIILVAGYARSFFPTFKTRKQKIIDKAKARGCVAEGILVKNHLTCGDRTSNNIDIRSDTMHCVYEYTVDGIAYKKKLSFQSPGMVTVQYPVKVTIYYDEQNPKKCACPQESTAAIRQGVGCLVYLGAAILTMAVVANLLKFFA